MECDRPIAIELQRLVRALRTARRADGDRRRDSRARWYRAPIIQSAAELEGWLSNARSGQPAKAAEPQKSGARWMPEVIAGRVRPKAGRLTQSGTTRRAAAVLERLVAGVTEPVVVPIARSRRD